MAIRRVTRLASGRVGMNVGGASYASSMSTASQDPFYRQRELLDEWVETRAEINRLEARAAALLAARIEVMDADVAAAPVHREAIRRSMVAEYSAAGRTAKGTVEQAFADARALHDDFPNLRESYAAGRVSAGHVREILRAAGPLIQAIICGEATSSDWTLYEAAALEFAETEAPARTRARAGTDRRPRAADDDRAAPRCLR